jgi:hypothetical protein
MILNQTTLDYTKHCVVPFGAYVQANHESTKTSSNVTRTLDALYLRPAQNQQGGHELMDLNSGQLISRNIVHEIPVTNAVIKAVENMAYQQSFKSLKFKNCNGVIYHYADWIAGVDYDDPDNYDDPHDIENEDEEYDNKEDENEDQLEQYEELEDQLKHIDPEEIEDIMRDARGESNPNMHEQHDNANEEQLEHPVEQQEVPAESTRRSTRETRPIERLEPKMSGKSYMQEQKKVNFKCDAEQELE